MKQLIIAALFLFSFNSHAQSIFERLKAPLVGAHQGGYPWKGNNNTIPKFNQAIKDGAAIIEMDVRATKDDVVIVYHDDKICSAEVRTLTYEQIKNCSRSKIETFEDVLIQINGRAIVNAEFKVQDVTVPAIKLVQKYAAYDWVYFQTKAERDRYILARKTDNRVALNYKAVNDAELDWALSHNDPYLVVIEMEKDMANPRNLSKAHQAKKLVSVNSWRYGSMEEFFSAACDKVFKLGIDIAIANNISGCVKQKSKYKKQPLL